VNHLAIIASSGAPAQQGGVIAQPSCMTGVPFTFYANWIQGGFLVVESGVAKALARQGFSVVEHDLEPGERAWLALALAIPARLALALVLALLLALAARAVALLVLHHLRHALTPRAHAVALWQRQRARVPVPVKGLRV
jgi:hypothetical protein